MPPTLLVQSTGNAFNNIPPGIANLVGRRLLRAPEHPLSLVRSLIEDCFPGMAKVRDLSPVVSVQQCFDDLLIPSDHVSRRPSDTFYVDRTTLLRTHTSAHQTDLLRSGQRSFLVSGDVYRKDSVDASHFPVFHQMEGVCVLPLGTSRQDAFVDLKSNLDRMADKLFGARFKRRWVDTTFPFTDPSTEMEIRFSHRNDWLEVLGCGVVHPTIMQNVGLGGQSAWAFGLGLERLAMILFDIPDIRLFWSQDPRFTSQFKGGLEKLRAGKTITFQPYSKFPAIVRDMCFWLDPATFNANDLFSIVREVAGDTVENVSLIDTFVHQPSGRHSQTFRIVYRSMDRNLTHADANAVQLKVEAQAEKELKIELRK